MPQAPENTKPRRSKRPKPQSVGQAITRAGSQSRQQPVRTGRGGSVGQAVTRAGQGRNFRTGPKPTKRELAHQRAVAGKRLGPYPVPRGAVKRKGGGGPGVLPLAIAHALGAVTPFGAQIQSRRDPLRIVLESTLRTTAQQPGRTAVDTGKSALGIPAGLVRLALHPVKGAEAIGKDYSRRYGPALRGNYAQFHRRQLAEGAAPEVFDLSGAVSAGGGITGRLLQDAARAGSLGERAARVATATRVTRTGAGDAAVLVRDPSVNFYRNAGAAAVHRRRAKVTRKRAARPEADVVVREAANAGQVAPVFKSTARRAQRKQAARLKGAAQQTLKMEQQRLVTGSKSPVTGAAKSLKRDVRDTALKYQMKYAPKTAEDAVRILKIQRARIVRERARRAEAGNPVRPIVDELPIIDGLIANAGAVFTPELRAAAKSASVTGRKVGLLDPGAGTAETVARRTYRPLGDALGVPREATGSAKDVLAYIQRAEGAPRARQHKLRGTPELPASETQWFHGTRGSFDTPTSNHGGPSNLGLFLTSDRKLAEKYAGEEVHGPGGAPRIHEVAVRPKKTLDIRYGTENRAALARVADALTARAKALDEAYLNGAGKAPPSGSAGAMRLLEKFRDGLAKARTVEQWKENEARLYDAAMRIGKWEGDAGFGGERALRETLLRMGYDSIRKGDDGADTLVALTDKILAKVPQRAREVADPTTALAYAKRVQAAARQRGVKTTGRPGYFPSEEIPSSVRAMFASGGTRANKEAGHYTGVLDATGRESGNFDVLVRGLATNIKRRVNWNLVADTVDAAAVPWTKDGRMTAFQLRKEMARRGVSEDSYRLMNPRLIRREQEAAVRAGKSVDEDVLFHDANVEQAVRMASGSAQDVGDHLRGTSRSEFKETGWVAVPKESHDEIFASVQSGKKEAAGRAYDITKGQLSRILLANPAWAGFQVASNSLMAGLFGSTPADVIRGARMFAHHTPEQKAAAEALFGKHGWYQDTRAMGAHGNAFTQTWGVLKETNFYRRVLAGHSPLTPFFKFDNAQNNLFRQTVMATAVKRQAFAQMNRDASTLVRAQRKLMQALEPAKTQAEIQRVLRDHPDLVEAAARKVDDFLGNWTTYTARERAVFGRFVMFYGFLRFSTRLAFYTMPLGHPLRTSMLLQLGRLEKQEVERIFGTEPPPWEYGNLYAPGKAFGEGLKPGESAGPRLPLVRMVPFFNALQFDSVNATLGMLNPLAGTVANQYAKQNVALGQPWKLNGGTANVEPSQHVGIGDRAQVALAELLNLSPYYRAASAGVTRGKQGSDSSLVFPQPTRYKQADAKARNAALIAAQQRRGVFGGVRETLFPLLGTEADQRIASARNFNESQRKKDGGSKVKLSPALERRAKLYQGRANQAQQRALERRAALFAKSR